MKQPISKPSHETSGYTNEENLFTQKLKGTVFFLKLVYVFDISYFNSKDKLFPKMHCRN